MHSYTDVLLGLLKKVRRKRPALRLIISSATADAEAFRAFFETNVGGDAGKDEATILSVVGRQHEVDVLYSVKVRGFWLWVYGRSMDFTHSSRAVSRRITPHTRCSPS